jgi:hypothetical protein
MSKRGRRINHVDVLVKVVIFWIDALKRILSCAAGEFWRRVKRNRGAGASVRASNVINAGGIPYSRRISSN